MLRLGFLMEYSGRGGWLSTLAGRPFISCFAGRRLRNERSIVVVFFSRPKDNEVAARALKFIDWSCIMGFFLTRPEPEGAERTIKPARLPPRPSPGAAAALPRHVMDWMGSRPVSAVYSRAFLGHGYPII